MTKKKAPAKKKNLSEIPKKGPAPHIISSKKISAKNKPVILITNDDGVTAPGIRNLVEAVKDLQDRGGGTG